MNFPIELDDSLQYLNPDDISNLIQFPKLAFYHTIIDSIEIMTLDFDAVPPPFSLFGLMPCPNLGYEVLDLVIIG